MGRHTTSRNRRIVTAAVAVTAVVTVVAGCGSAKRADDAGGAGAGGGGAGGTGATASTSPVASSSPSTTRAGATGGTPGSSSTTGGYPSAITHEVVDNPALDGFEKKMTARMAKVGLPGVSLLVMQHGKLVEQEAWMAYDLDTVVPIASASKWLTAATIMTLVDEGKVSLDAPISTYLDFAKGKFGTITLRQLLSLTSGIRSDDDIPCYKDQTVTLQDCNRQIATLPLESEPGVAFRYGGQHMHVAAGVAEAVTGQSWNELFKNRIAAPLGMDHTTFRGLALVASDNPVHPTPAGSGASTLGDYGRFLEMIAHGGRAPSGQQILRPETVAEMQTNQLGKIRRYNGPPYRNAELNPYGLGEWLDWADADNKAIVLSSDGAFGFRPWIDKKNDIVGVYMIQDTGAGVVEGDPRDTPDASDVPTSGPWVFDDVAQALGGSLPADKTPGPPLVR